MTTTFQKFDRVQQGFLEEVREAVRTSTGLRIGAYVTNGQTCALGERVRRRTNMQDGYAHNIYTVRNREEDRATARLDGALTERIYVKNDTFAGSEVERKFYMLGIVDDMLADGGMIITDYSE